MKCRASSIQEESSTVPGRRKKSHGARAAAAARFEPPAQRTVQRKISATGDIGHRGGVVARAGVGYQDFGDETGGGAGNEGGEGPHQRPFQNPVSR